MGTFVALLRSINVGGRNKVAMSDLRGLATALGYADVSTYVQSGNLVFSAPGGAAAVGRALHDSLASELGVDVAVLVRSRSQWEKVSDGNLLVRPGVDPATLHVTFLAASPDEGARRALEARSAQFGGDRLAVDGAEVYLHCPDGYSNSKLTNAYLERQLGTTATTRNWRTVLALADRIGGGGRTGR
jgi:uncharacterized protein (DUF1697 family)